MDYAHAVILGIIEGITEFLPISSTGHLILADTLLGLAKTEFLKSFEIAIQLGAILAVLVLYWKRITHDRTYMRKVLLACVPTGMLGVGAYPFIKAYLLDSPLVVLVALLVGGIAILVIEKWYEKKVLAADADDALSSDISYRHALYVGAFQAIAFIPGVSRAASTILGGMLLKLKRKTVVEFSFLLAVPTMAAAAGYDALQSQQILYSENIPLLAAGFMASAITAYAAVRLLVRYIEKRGFKIFGWYRIAVALVLLFVLYK